MGSCISKRNQPKNLHPYSPEYQQKMFEKAREFFLREKEMSCLVIDDEGEWCRMYGEGINFLTLHTKPAKVENITPTELSEDDSESVTPTEMGEIEFGYTFDFYGENTPKFNRLFYDFDLDEQFFVSNEPIKISNDTSKRERKMRLVVKYNSLDESELFGRKDDEDFISGIYILNFDANFYDLMRSVQDYRMDLTEGKYVIRHTNILESYESNYEYRNMVVKQG